MFDQSHPTLEQGGISSGTTCETPLLHALAERYRDVLTARHRDPHHVSTKFRHVTTLLDLIGVRFPAQLHESAIEIALGEVSSTGRSVRTVNHFLASFRSFCRWMVRNRNLTGLREDPTAGIEMLRSDTDHRHARTAFTDAELGRLFSAVASSGETYYGCAPEDRLALYRAAVGTGLRRNTLRLLLVEQFEFGACPGVRVKARQEKSRRDRFVPLRVDDAAELYGYLRGRMPKSPAFRLPKLDHEFMLMYRCDLARARIKYCEEGQSQTPGRRNREQVRDFHSLRHTYCTRLALAGVPLKVAQTLMGHSSPELTAKVYSHVSHEDQSSFLSRLPPLPPVTIPKAG